MSDQPFSAGIESNNYPLVSIVIPTKNRHDSLDRLLASIAKQDYPNFDVTIVDDGSETPVELRERNAEGVALIRNHKSRGCCSARNIGIEYATGEFVVVLDDDAELDDENTLSRAVNLVVSQPDCGAVGFCQLQADGQAHYMQPAQANHPCFTSVFFGYGFLLRRQAIVAVGKFNPLLGIYYDENEFCLRLLNFGYKSIYDPSLRVIHHHDLRGRDSIRMHRLILRNSIITALLHFPLWCLPPHIVTRLIHFVRLSRADGKGVDWYGVRWVFRDIAHFYSTIKHDRKAMPFKTLLYFRRLSRAPIPIH